MYYKVIRHYDGHEDVTYEIQFTDRHVIAEHFWWKAYDWTRNNYKDPIIKNRGSIDKFDVIVEGTVVGSYTIIQCKKKDPNLFIDEEHEKKLKFGKYFDSKSMRYRLCSDGKSFMMYG